MKKTVKWAVVVLSFVGMMMNFIGCSKNKNNNDNTAKTSGTVTTAEAKTRAEGAVLDKLYYHHSGTAMEPYYLICRTDGGIYLKVTDSDPEFDAQGEYVEDIYSGVTTVSDHEYGCSVVLPEEDVERLEQAIDEYSVLSWDGYSVYKQMPEGMLDGDSSFSFNMELSDGTTVDASGSLAVPDGYGGFIGVLMDVVEKNEDYSAYLETDFTASEIVSLTIDFKDSYAGRQDFKLSLVSKRWSVIIKDPKGEEIEAGTDIMDYGEADAPLPFDSFAAILTKYGVNELAPEEHIEDYGSPSLEIRLYFENGKSFELVTSDIPENYYEIRAEFVSELMDFYNEIKV